MLVCDGRITGEGLKGLLKTTECKFWLSADDRWTLKTAGIHDGLVAEQSFPSLEWCLADLADVPDYPYNKTWEEAKDDEITIIHTSGTTGMTTSK